jgi:hypothetical protein
VLLRKPTPGPHSRAGLFLPGQLKCRNSKLVTWFVASPRPGIHATHPTMPDSGTRPLRLSRPKQPRKRQDASARAEQWEHRLKHLQIRPRRQLGFMPEMHLRGRERSRALAGQLANKALVNPSSSAWASVRTSSVRRQNIAAGAPGSFVVDNAHPCASLRAD